MPLGFKKNKSKASNNSQIVLRDKRDQKIESLTYKIKTLDQKINSITQELIKSQLAGLRIEFSKKKGLVGEIQRQWYRSSVKDSANWHKDRLTFLLKEKRALQLELDKLSGKYWLNIIYRWITCLIIMSIAIFSIWILFMGLLTAIYLLPIFIVILILFFMFQKKTNLF